MTFSRLVWVGVLLALGLVLAGSLIPGNIKLVPFDLPDQKHFMAYALLGFGFMLAWRPGGLGVLVVVLGLALLGFSVEVAQSFIPDRFFRWIDVASNAAGAAVGAGVGWGIKRMKL